jgi:hypothetical protein
VHPTGQKVKSIKTKKKSGDAEWSKRRVAVNFWFKKGLKRVKVARALLLESTWMQTFRGGDALKLGA